MQYSRYSQKIAVFHNLMKTTAPQKAILKSDSYEILKMNVLMLLLDYKNTQNPIQCGFQIKSRNN